MANFIGVTNSGENGPIFVNMDLVRCISRENEHTLLEFVGPSGDDNAEYVNETPEQILLRLYTPPFVFPPEESK